MKQYLETENGDFKIGDIIIPNSEANRDYNIMQTEIANNEAEIISYAEPTKTNQELIIEIESTMTQRNLRCAALGDAVAISKLQEIEDQIQVLRS